MPLYCLTDLITAATTSQLSHRMTGNIKNPNKFFHLPSLTVTRPMLILEREPRIPIIISSLIRLPSLGSDCLLEIQAVPARSPPQLRSLFVSSRLFHEPMEHMLQSTAAKIQISSTNLDTNLFQRTYSNVCVASPTLLANSIFRPTGRQSYYYLMNRWVEVGFRPKKIADMFLQDLVMNTIAANEVTIRTQPAFPSRSPYW